MFLYIETSRSCQVFFLKFVYILIMNLPELLAPAGSPEALNAAVAEGADAIYLGLKNFNARMRSVNFTYPQFEAALKALHRMGKKLYVTVNTVFEEREADRLYQFLKYLAALEPDGIIVQDLGVITMVRENFPSLKIFASTQMNISSSRAANLLSGHGVSRVILGRELSLEEIRGIRQNTNVELEVFVHGALCMSVSGLCLFSSFLGGKSANRGMCTQACRRYFFQEENAGQGSESGYFFSPCDLELIEKIPALSEIGVNSFKIEGRMKSAEYVGTVVSAYRLVLDSLVSGESKLNAAIIKASEILKRDFARSKTTYLIDGNIGFNWLKPDQAGGTGIPLGKILKVKGSSPRYGLIEEGPLLPVIGDTIRLHRADDSHRASHKIASTEDCWVTIPDEFEKGDSVYLIQTKAMTKRYPRIIDKNAKVSGRGPGWGSPGRGSHDRGSRDLHSKSARKAQALELGEGFYVQVSRVEDLYIVQSQKPEKVIITYNSRFLSQFLSPKKPLPFSPASIIVSFDPFFPQDQEENLEQDIDILLDKGFRFFILNNPGHFSFFKNKMQGIILIGGPWLYVFNSFSLSFISSIGADYFISPLENNRQNLERTFSGAGLVLRQRVFITVFSCPSLFRTRSNLDKFYNFKKFKSHENEMFSLASSSQGSLVYPEKPFYIADKIPFLKKSGFNRFILDLSSRPLNKFEYKDLMNAASKAAPPNGMSRFNWKDGFFKPD